MTAVSFKSLAPSILIGLLAGALSGLLGVGGGIVIVPLLVAVVGLSQHAAHATSLAAIVPIAAVGATTFALDGEVDWVLAALLGGGALVGAQFGARVMARTGEGALKMAFGALMIAVAVQMAAA